MRRAVRAIAAGCLAWALLAAPVGAAGPVDAVDHDAFWLWAGVRPQPVLAQARTLYILQGQIDPPGRAGAEARMIAAEAVARG